MEENIRILFENDIKRQFDNHHDSSSEEELDYISLN